jgi:hypothetical protein
MLELTTIRRLCFERLGESWSVRAVMHSRAALELRHLSLVLGLLAAISDIKLVGSSWILCLRVVWSWWRGHSIGVIDFLTTFSIDLCFSESGNSSPDVL